MTIRRVRVDQIGIRRNRIYREAMTEDALRELGLLVDAPSMREKLPPCGAAGCDLRSIFVVELGGDETPVCRRHARRLLSREGILV